MGDNGIKARPNLNDKLGLKCWALRESRLSPKAIAAKLGLVSEWSVKQLISRNRRGLEAEIAGLEAEDAKLRRLVLRRSGPNRDPSRWPAKPQSLFSSSFIS